MKNRQKHDFEHIYPVLLIKGLIFTIVSWDTYKPQYKAKWNKRNAFWESAVSFSCYTHTPDKVQWKLYHFMCLNILLYFLKKL